MPGQNFYIPDGQQVIRAFTFDDRVSHALTRDITGRIVWVHRPDLPVPTEVLVWDVATNILSAQGIDQQNVNFRIPRFSNATLPVASTALLGAVCFNTDLGQFEICNGAAWVAFANISGTLTLNQILLGGGGTTINSLGTLGTATTVLHGNAGGAPTFGAVGLTTDVSGILPSANGGTGANLSAAAQGSVPYFNPAGTLTTLSPGTLGQFLQTRGAGANPVFSNAPAALTQFSGLEWRTHPDQDKAANQVQMFNLDSVVMDDSVSYFPVLRKGTDAPLTADITTNGAGGLDTGSRVASTWYELYVIGKGDGVSANCRLLLHRAKNYFLDQNQTLSGSIAGLLNNAAAQQLAQTFTPTVSGKLEFIDLAMSFSGGTIAGRRFWVELQADSAGVPSGTALATSDKLVSEAWGGGGARFIRLIFRSPFSVTATTKMWLVMKGDYAVDAANFITWNFNAAGTNQFYTFNGTVWSPVANATAAYITYITQNDTAVTMPATFTGKAKLGYVFVNATPAFIQVTAKDKVERFVDTSQIAVSSIAVYSVQNVVGGLPPVPVVSHWAGLLGANTTLEIIGVPDGYRSAAGNAGGILGMYINTNLGAGAAWGGQATVFTEYQGLVVFASVGSTAYAIGFQW